MYSRADLVAIVDNFPALLSIGDVQGAHVATSPLLLKLLGYTLEEYTSQPFLNYVHPDDLATMIQSLGEMQEENSTIDGAPSRWRKKDGTYIWLRWKAKTDQGFIFATAQDVTKELALEADNFESHSQFERILKNAPGMIYQFKMDADGTAQFPFASDKAFDIYEIQPGDFKAEPALMLKMVHPDDKLNIDEAILTSAKELTPFEWAGRIITKTGKTRWIKARSIPRKLPDGAVLWDGLVVDATHEVTLQKELEQQRMVSFHSARLASIGELAAGVGHEINNPLAIIMGKAERLQKKLTAANTMTDDLARDITVCLDARNRIRRIVDGLRTLSRKAAPPGTIGNVNEAVNGTIALIRQIYMQDGIEITSDLPAHDILVACDLPELQQVVMNLLANAKDATKGLDNRQIAVIVGETSTQALVRIKDNGSGIPLAIQPKIFDGFFTTKPVGQGTGIGLALSRSIVISAGGDIIFTTEEGKGTEFIMRLPKATEGGSQGQPAASSNQAESSNKIRGRALLVDDEDGVREVLAEILQDSGFDVTCASGADEALAQLAQSDFDLIMSDQKMPGKSGMEFLKILQQKKVPLRCKRILITAGSFDAFAANKSLQDGTLADAVMTKPFTEAQLREVLVKLMVFAS